MIHDNEDVMLFIEPKQNKSDTPVLDELTIKMFNAFKNYQEEGVYTGGNFVTIIRTMGYHQCKCGKFSSDHDYKLNNGKITNYLCVHYMAYHRDEVPEVELNKVKELDESIILLDDDKDALDEMIELDESVTISDEDQDVLVEMIYKY